METKLDILDVKNSLSTKRGISWRWKPFGCKELIVIYQERFSGTGLNIKSIWSKTSTFMTRIWGDGKLGNDYILGVETKLDFLDGLIYIQDGLGELCQISCKL